MDANPTATDAAAAAAEAVPTLNRQTLAPLSPGTPGWEDIADLSAVVGELWSLAQRLPQAFDQVGRPLDQPAPGTRYAIDSPDLVADDVVEAAKDALAAATISARRLESDLARAHAAISHLYVPDELRVAAGE